MNVSTDLISQFAKITNDQKVSRIDEVTLYGEVVEFEDRICVKFDGSSEITPVTTISDVDENGNTTNYRYGSASVKAGDRVSVCLKNHSATITGNLSDPSMGRAEFTVAEDYILAQVDAVSLKVDAQGVSINGLTTFTNTTSNRLDSLSNGLADGTTIIDGGCIKTGTIDAKRINLEGSLCYQYSVDGVSDWHDEQTDADQYRRESFDGGTTWKKGYKFVGTDGENGSDGSDASVPSYIRSTYIDGTKVSSFHIQGNKIECVIPEADGEDEDVGFILTSTYGNSSFRYLRIYALDNISPDTVFESPLNGYARWNFGFTYFTGNVQFMGTTSGVTAEFA